MFKYQAIFLLVWICGQICGGQIFGGGGRPPIPRHQAQQGQGHPPPRGGGILQPNIPRGGIFGGQGVGPGGGGGHHREGGLFHQGSSENNRGQNKQKDRVRVGPIVFDAENLNFDDDDDYANGDDDAYRRPQLGLDLSNVFTPLVNFAKLSGKSFETFATMLEKQANLLLGRKGREGSLSVTIVIIISWLVIGLVVYALAQFAMLRRLREEEELELLREQEAALLGTPTAENQVPFLNSIAITPPTPQNGTIPQLPNQVNGEKLLWKKSMWLPSVGALQLSESSILKRRASLKRKRSLKGQQQIGKQCSVDCETLTWIERGLDRLYSEEDLMLNVLNKWHAFLKTRVMQDTSQDGYNITYQRLVVSDLPKVRRIDVEKSDEENMIISMDIEAQFSADVTVDRISTVTESRLNVTLMQTRIECKLSRQNIEDNMIHIRQTGHVNLEAAWSEPETDCEALNLIQLAIINVLKSVDCDLPPLAELCQEASDGGTSGIFVESPSSYSSPSLNQTDSSEDCEDYLQVSVLKATLLEDQDQQVCCSSTAAVPFHPYVILEMDHPAQRYNTMPTEHVKNGPKNSREFTWPNGHLFKFHISRQKSFELLVELWESATATLERPPDRICDNVSPGAVGHRFLGLCLVSVRDLISTPSQTHVVSLQGRPFQDDLVLNWTITLQFEYVPDVSPRGTSSSSLQLTQLTTFDGVHKTLAMKQSLDPAGQPTFITNSYYTQKKGGTDALPLPTNSVALAAIRDLQTQQNLRLGTLPATKSVLLIRSIQKHALPISPRNSIISPPSPVNSRGEPFEPLKKTGSNEAFSFDEDAIGGAAGGANGASTEKKPQGSKVQQPSLAVVPKRKGFFATFKERFSMRKSRPAPVTSSELPSQELSSSILEEDSASISSGESTTDSEQSYELTPWRGTLSTSWESLTSIGSSTLLVPNLNEDASSLSEASGISLHSSSGVNAGNASMMGTPPGGKKNLTSLILETVEDHGFLVHYLMPKNVAKKARLKRKGVKLHVSNEHIFTAKHIKSGTICSVCQKKIVTRLGKKCYICRNCGLVCHKGCYDRTLNSCTKSTLESMELYRGSTLFKKKGT